MTTTLAAVFAPIGLTGGLTGSLFSEFAFTLVFTVLVSAMVALTLSPMLSSKVLKPAGEHGLVHALDVAFDRIRESYDRSLRAVLRHRAAAILVAVVVFVTIPVMFLGTPSELAPTEDQGLILVSATGPATATLHYLNRYSRKIAAIFRTFKQTGNIFQINGLSFGGGAANALVGGMKLVPWNQRNVSQMALMPLVQQKLSGLTGVQAVAFPKPSLPGSAGGLPIQFVITSPGDFRHINAVANELIGKSMRSGLFAFLTKDLRYDNPEVVVRVNRNLAGNLGVTMANIGDNLEPLLGGNLINRFDIQGRSYKVIPQVPDRFRADPAALHDYYIRSQSGSLIPLSTLVSLHTEVDPEYLPQFQQLNSATVEGVPAPGVTLGKALAYLGQEAQHIMPAGFAIHYASQSRQYVQEGHTIVITFMLAIILVYLLLAAQFESFRDPLIVMVTVPMAISGALIFLYLGAGTLNIYTEVGLVTLIGLITKQGILIVQFANVIQETEGADRNAAVEKASSIRLRPILMTTGAMVFGAMPLVFASGPGAVSRFDMGLVIASGLGIGALFSLYMVPVIYSYLARDRRISALSQD